MPINLQKMYTFWQNTLLVLSNVFILASVRLSYLRKLYMETYILFQSGVVSGIYHLFISINYEKENPDAFYAMRILDFYSATLVLIMLSVYVMRLKYEYKPIPVLILSSITIFLLHYHKWGWISETIISSICLITIVISFIVRRQIPQWHPKNLLISLIFISAGLLCFHYTSEKYWLYHSLWHIFIMTSTYFVLKYYPDPLNPVRISRRFPSIPSFELTQLFTTHRPSVSEPVTPVGVSQQ